MAIIVKINQIISVVITISLFLTICYGSAIPMWEYLSRGEKMSHLYSTFAKQVSSYCKSSGDSQPAECKRELLMYGLGKLHEMSESHLDSMDPYQRGANDIIWDSMMDGHPSHSKKDITTPSSIMYPTGHFIKNPLFDEKPLSKNKNKGSDKYASDMELSIYSGSDSMYLEPQNTIHQEAPTNLNLNYAIYPNNRINYDASNYLSGPMVIRVRPDGTPVEEDMKKPLPRDDDRPEMQIGHEKLPTMEQIAEIFKIDSSTRRLFDSQTIKFSTFSPSHYKNYRMSERSTLNYH